MKKRKTEETASEISVFFTTDVTDEPVQFLKLPVRAMPYTIAEALLYTTLDPRTFEAVSQRRVNLLEFAKDKRLSLDDVVNDGDAIAIFVDHYEPESKERRGRISSSTTTQKMRRIIRAVQIERGKPR